MLPQDDLTLAIDIQSRSYKLLRWVAEAIEKGFVPVKRAHEYANVSDSALDWIDEHYLNFPPETRPDRRYIRNFANFFSTYVMSSFDIIEKPGTRLHSTCGCYCSWCAHIINASHLQPMKLTKRDKTRAVDLMIDRVSTLAFEEGVHLEHEEARAIVLDFATRRMAGYSAYGYWLIKRMEGITDGKSVLALWREIAWNKSGSPIKNFKLRYKDFANAEELIVQAMNKPFHL
jgi:hypothetical protein